VRAVGFILGILLILGGLGALALALTGGLWSLLSFVAFGELACAALLIAWAASLRMIGAAAVVLGLVIWPGALFSVGLALLYGGRLWVIFAACLTFIAVSVLCGWVIPWGWSKERASRGRSELPGRIPEDRRKTP
jgi:hypothetical protein